jgi:glycosyltransferase involved in cell wall biosynthesis
VGKKALTEALEEMVSKPETERKTMGQRGRELVLHNYTWDIAARKMITVYKAMLNGDKIPLYPMPWNDDV